MKKKKMALLVALVFISTILYISCGDNTADNRNNSKNNNARDGYATYTLSQPMIALDDGTILTGETEISAAFKEIFRENPNEEFNLDISGSEVPADADPMGMQPAVVVIPISYNYSVVSYMDNHYIGACINRVVTHLNFKITKKDYSGSVYNLHIAGWRTGGRLCVGIYATTYNKPAFCWAICSPTPRDIIGGIAATLIAMGITYTIAWALAYIMGPIACAALLI